MDKRARVILKSIHILAAWLKVINKLSTHPYKKIHSPINIYSQVQTLIYPRVWQCNCLVTKTTSCGRQQRYFMFWSRDDINKKERQVCPHVDSLWDESSQTSCHRRWLCTLLFHRHNSRAKVYLWRLHKGTLHRRKPKEEEGEKYFFLKKKRKRVKMPETQTTLRQIWRHRSLVLGLGKRWAEEGKWEGSGGKRGGFSATLFWSAARRGIQCHAQPEVTLIYNHPQAGEKQTGVESLHPNQEQKKIMV